MKCRHSDGEVPFGLITIVLGDDSHTDSLGKGRIDIDHGKFRNVLYVPGLASKLLSV